jgi:predicted deacylase
MTEVIEKIKTFRALRQQVAPDFGIEDALEIKGPPGSKVLTVFAIVHGDETGGLAALTRFLSENIKDPPITIRLALGNIPACLENKRYLHSDLNRSFGRSSAPQDIEQERAKALEPLLQTTDYFIDIHQTREPVASAFFYFPLQKRSSGVCRGPSNGSADHHALGLFLFLKMANVPMST